MKPKPLARDPWGGTYLIKDRPPDPPPPDEAAAEKFNESDWVRNSGRFSDFIGQSDGGGRGGGGGAGAAPSAEAVVRAEVALRAIQQKKLVRISPEEMDDFIPLAAGNGHNNLGLMQVTGEGNENLFQRHAREIPRHEMPQIPSGTQNVENFKVYLAMHGISHANVNVDPRALHATQNELDSKKVGEIAGKFTPETQIYAPILVSREGAVLDGHHRWAALSAYAINNPGVRLPTITVNAPLDTALDHMTDFNQIFGIQPKRLAD